MSVETSGRVGHTHKITVYLTAEELHRLDLATAELRYKYGVRVDRGRVVREALWLALEGLERNGVRSWLVERLREIR